jgi:hydrogenase maturation protease
MPVYTSWHRFSKGCDLKVLILGYGNIDRQDDGVAWHILVEVMKRLGVTPPNLEEDEMPVTSGDYEFQFHLQLTPELADELGSFDKAVFIDAHTGAVPEEIHEEVVTPHYQSSPFTHHMTTSTLLSLCKVIHKKYPLTLLVSVRGYEFLFTRSLSQRTQNLVEEAASRIIEWIAQPV